MRTTFIQKYIKHTLQKSWLISRVRGHVINGKKNRQNEEAKRRDVVHIFVRRKKPKIEKGWVENYMEFVKRKFVCYPAAKPFWFLPALFFALPIDRLLKKILCWIILCVCIFFLLAFASVLHVTMKQQQKKKT